MNEDVASSSVTEPRAVKELIELGLRVLDDSTHLFDDHDHEIEARELLGFVLDLEDDEELDETFEPPRPLRERYLSLVARRAGGEPFPFLVGYIDFYGLRLKVRPGAFIPRPSSELAVERCVKHLSRKKGAVAVDVCCGQGPIALAIADELSTADVWGLDIDDGGIAQGRKNARELGIRNVRLRAGDLFEPLPKKYLGGVDLVVAHVPYVALHELDDMPTEVIEFEPVYTLSDESDDGLDLMRRVIVESKAWLKPGGWLLLEMADDLAPKVRASCREAGYLDEGAATDEDGLSVVVEARKPR